MRAVRIHEEGGPEVLRLEELDVPEPGRGAALVRVRASALNRLDVWIRRGLPSVPKPRTLGADGAGVVEQLGPGARGVEVGMPVVINPGLFCGRCRFCMEGEQSLCLKFNVLGEHVDGTHADYVVVPTHNLHPLPGRLSFEQAAAYPLVFATAWRMLFTKARLQAGEWVLIWGAGSGVGSAAVELAKAVGARVIATASSDAKLTVARERGADAVVNHARENVGEAVRTITEGRGVDVVYEHPGKATWAISLDVLRKGGRLVITGATTGGGPPAQLHRIFWKQLTIYGSTMASDSEFRAVSTFMASGRIEPIIDRVYRLEDMRDAHERLEAGEHHGKIVIRVSE